MARRGKPRFAPSAVLVLARGGGAAIGLVLQILLARDLGASNLGIFYTAVSLIGICSVLGAIGYPSLANRFVARYRVRQGSFLLAAFLRAGAWDILLVSMALAAVVAVFALRSDGAPALQHALLAASLSIPAMALARFLSAIANADRRFFLGFLPELLVRPAALLGVVSLLLACNVELTAEGVLLVYAVLSWIFVAVQLTHVRTELDRGLRRRQRTRLAPHWRRLSGILVLLPLLTTMLADFQILLVAAISPSEAVGVFGAVLKVAALCAFVIQIIQQTAMPDLAEAAHTGSLDRALRDSIPGTSLALLAVAGAGIFVLLFGPPMLKAFGADFGSAYWPLVVAVFGLAPRAAAGPSLQLLVVMKHHKASILAGAASLAVLSGLTMLLVPPFGVMGAAIAFASSGVFLAALGGVLLWRLEGVRSDVFVVFKTAGATPLQVQNI